MEISDYPRALLSNLHEFMRYHQLVNLSQVTWILSKIYIDWFNFQLPIAWKILMCHVFCERKLAWREESFWDKFKIKQVTWKTSSDLLFFGLFVGEWAKKQRYAKKWTWIVFIVIGAGKHSKIDWSSLYHFSQYLFSKF